MHTVSTLCATGSIIGAASLGCAFVGASLPEPQSRSQTPFPTSPGTTLHPATGSGAQAADGQAQSPAISSQSSQPSRPETPLHPILPQRVQPRSTPSQPKPQAAVGLGVRGTSAVPQPSVFTEDGSPGASDTQDSSATSFRKRSSRLVKRFSNFSLAQESTPSPTDRPLSRVWTDSSGSSAPFFSPSLAVNNPPRNKLVKRSVSQHLPNERGGQPLIRRHTLDRPATRHKRLATLSSGSWAHDETAEPSDPSMYEESDGAFSLYFTTRSTTYLDTPSKIDQLGGSFIRRIVPAHSTKPVLCPAGSVKTTTKSPAVVGESSFVFGSRPTSSGGLFHFFSSPGPAQQEFSPSPRLQSARRSFSVSDFLSRSPPPDRQRRRFKLRLGRRVVTAPSVAMVAGRTPDDASHTNKRRNTNAGLSTQSSPKQAERQASGSSQPLEQVTTPPRSSRPHASSLPLQSARTPPSNVSLSSLSRHSRHSAAHSDLTSSQLGSDSDGRVFSSADEDEMRSDTAYDSMRTGTTKSNSGFRGPPLETLFDKDSPSAAGHGDDSHFLYFGSNASPSPITTKGPALGEEDSSTSTPGRTVTAEKRDSHRSPGHDALEDLPSSPPSLPKALNLGQLPWHLDADDDETAWSEDDQGEAWDTNSDPFQSAPRRELPDSPETVRSIKRRLHFTLPEPGDGENDSKGNLFDWSEPTAVDRGLRDSPPPRPKTVHGKKNTDAMGSGTGTRRAPSGLHARSQSVPVLADLVGKRTSITSKFGTWGVGSKGVTEDWNDDFEFETEPAALTQGTTQMSQAEIEQRTAMVVPDAIKAQQTNILANIGLLREWGLLIEELKELRARASTIGIETDDFAETFDEVDAMIELADQEAEDKPLRSPASKISSPGFDFEDVGHPSSSPAARDTLEQRGDSDLQTEPDSRTPKRTSTPRNPQSGPERPNSIRRPRKDSEAVAQSVIEALQSRSQPTLLSTPDQPGVKKIPFDTRTLRKIVPHVNALVKKVKQILREAEGLNSSPKIPRRSPDHTLRQAFLHPQVHGSDDEEGR